MARGNGDKSILSKLFAVATLAVIAYLVAAVVPLLVSSFRLSQAMDDEVLHGNLNESANIVRRRIVDQATTLGLDIPVEQIVVTKNGPQYTIDANYIVPIELIGGVTFDWHVRTHKRGIRRSTALLHD